MGKSKSSPGETGRVFLPPLARRPGGRVAVLALVLAAMVGTGGPVFADPDPGGASTSQPAPSTSDTPPGAAANATGTAGTATDSTTADTPTPSDSPTADPSGQAPSPSDQSPADSPSPDQAPSSGPPAEAPAPAAIDPRAPVDLALSVYAPEAANAGSTITWTLTVTNNGPGAASAFTVTDTLPIEVTGISSPGCSVAGNVVTCAGAALAAGASTTLTVNGSTPTPFTFPLVNSASVATAPTDSDADTANNEATTVTTTAAPAPQLGLLATAHLNDTNGNGVGDAGESIGYSFTVHNSGNVTLFNLALQFNGGGTTTCADTTLSLNESTTCSVGTHVITAADVTAGQVVTTSTATATAPDGAAVSSGQSVTNIPTFAAAPAIKLVRTAVLGDTNGDNLGEQGEQIDYRFLVSNSGNVPLTNIVVTGDDLTTNPCAAVTTVQPNQTVECVRQPVYVITAQDAVNGTVVHNAIATGVAPGGTSVTSDTSTTTTPTFVPAPAVTIAQTFTPGDENNDGLVEAGETVRFKSTITNNGNVKLTDLDVTVIDGAPSSAGCVGGLTAQPGETVVCNQSLPYVVTPQDAAAGAVTRTVRAHGTAPGGTIVQSTDVTSSIPVFVPRPSIGLTLHEDLVDGNGNGIGDLGEQVRFSVTVSNTGNVPLTNVIVEGQLSGNAETICPQAVMIPEQSATCVRPLYTISQHDVDVGAVLGIGTAVGTAPDGARIRSTPIAANIPVFDPDPVLALVKNDHLRDGNGNGLADLDEPIDYTFAVTNVGNVTVTGLNIQDATLSGTTCPTTTLAPQQSTTCTSNAPHVTTVDDIDAAEVINVATARGTAPDGSTVVSPQSRTNTPTFVANPALALDKRAVLGDTNNNGLADLGERIQWSFLVVNNGTLPLHGLHIADPVAGAVTCPATDLAVLAATTCVADAPHNVTEADILLGKVANTAIAIASLGDAANTEVVSPPDSTITPTAGPNPVLTLAKRADLVDTNNNELADKGETINYSFVLTNTGNVTLTNLRVDDPKAGPVTCPSTTLAPGATVTCTAAPYIVTGDDIAAGIVRNVAVGYGTPPTGPPVQTPPATAEVPIANPALELVKNAVLNDTDDDNLASIGETITYTFVLTNTGNVPLTDISVDDPKAGVVTCPVTTLAPAASTTCTAEPYEVTEDDVAAGVVHNVAVASGQPPGTGGRIIAPPASRDVPTTSGQINGDDANQAGSPSSPAIGLEKKAALHDTDGDNLADVGELIDYSFVVTNTGDVALTNILVNDPKLTDVTCPSTALAVGASVTCTHAGYVVTQADIDAGTVHNVATATGDVTGGDSVTSLPATADVPVDNKVVAAATPQGGVTPALAETGVPGLVTLFGWAIVSLVGGALLLLGGRGRRKRA